MKKISILIVSLVLCFFSSSQTTSITDYLNQRLPVDTPGIFAAGLVSDGFANRDFTISPSGDEIFFTIQQRDLVSVVMNSKKKNGKWSPPAVAFFSGIYNDLEACFTIDGKKVFFSSNRPLNGKDSTNDYNIWFTEKRNDSWTEPAPLGPEVNSEKDEFYPSAAKNGGLYFTTQLENGKGREDIVMCEFKNGKYLPPVSLPEAINSKGYEFNAFVDPDEQFILFTAYGRTDDMGQGDLYLSVKKNGKWQQAINLGRNINGMALDYCPFVTWDKKYLFFTSSRARYRSPFEKRQTIQDLKKGLSDAGNGFDDIYWVRFDNILEAAEK